MEDHPILVDELIASGRVEIDEEQKRWFKFGEPLIEKTAANLETKGLPARKMLARARELVEIFRKRGY